MSEPSKPQNPTNLPEIPATSSETPTPIPADEMETVILDPKVDGAKVDGPDEKSNETEAEVTNNQDDTSTEQNAKTPTNKPASSSSSRLGLGLILAILAIVLIAALSAGGWWLWQQIQSQDQALHTLAAQQHKRLSQTSETFNSRAAESERKLDVINGQQRQLYRQQLDLQNALDSVRVFAAKGPTAWVLAEVEYLLRIANHRVQLQRDPVTAKIALQAADQRLRELADPAMLSVRQQIARELSALQAVVAPDIAGITLKLSSLSERVHQLPLRGAAERSQHKPTTKAQNDDNASEINRDWREALDTVWTDVKGLVTVRRHNRPVQALMSPEQQAFLYENLRLRLESARLNALRADDQAFQIDLQQLQAWLKEYFLTDSPETQAFIKQIGTLSQNNVAPALPDISASLRVMRFAMKQIQQTQLAPAPLITPSDTPASESLSKQTDRQAESTTESQP